MSTRSSARNLFPPLDNPELTIRRRSRADPTLLNDFEMATEGNAFKESLAKLCSSLALMWPVSYDLKSSRIVITDIPPSADSRYQISEILGNNHGNPSRNNQVRNQFFQGASHGQNPPPAYQASSYQAPVQQAPIPQPQVVTTTEFTNYMKANDVILKNMQTNMTSLTNSNLELKNMFGQFMKMNTASYSVAPVSAPKPNPKPSISYPSRLHDQKLRDKANDQKEKIFKIFQDLNFNISFADTLTLMPKFGPSIKSLLTNKDKLYELARTPLNEHCSVVLLKKLPEKSGDPGMFLILCDFPEMDECLALADLGASINLFPLSMWNKLSLLELYPTDSDFLLGKVDAFLALEDDATLPEVDHSYYDPEGDIFLFEAFLNDDPSLPPPTHGNYLPQVRKKLKIYEAKTNKSSINEDPKIELKDLSPHLEHTFLEDEDKLPVIIAKDLSIEEKVVLIKVLKSHKQAIAWKLSDIKGIDP
nr:reverse transcriptase domain-containing protein [Tanacetum cinerariifolium]